MKKVHQLLLCLVTGISAVVLLGPSGAEAELSPAPQGPAVQVDFSQPFIEKWYKKKPKNVLTATLPKLADVDWEAIADSPVWKESEHFAPLLRGEAETEFRAFYTESGLYLCIRSQFDTKPQAKSAENFLWHEDLVETRLHIPSDVPYRENPYFHFAVSSAGAVYDSREGNEGSAQRKATVRWLSKVEVGDGVWTAWIKVPFSDLGISGPVPEIQANIGRSGPAVSRCSWAPDWPETSGSRFVLKGIAAQAKGEGGLAAASMDSLPESRMLRTGRGIALNWITGVARPQDRWIEGEVLLDPKVLQDGDVVEVALRRPEGGEALATTRVEPERSKGKILVDIRRFGLEDAEIEVRLVRGEKTLGFVRSFLHARPGPGMPEEGFRLPLRVSVPQGPSVAGPWPLMVGIPFPAGMLWSKDGWVVEDERGKQYPTQVEVTGLWALEGAVKWLRVDTVAPPGEALYLAYRPGTAVPTPQHPVHVEKSEAGLVLSNGLVEYRLSAERSPVTEIRVGDRVLAETGNARGLYLVDQGGRLATASGKDAEIRMEAEGPVNACVRIEGWLRTENGEPVARHITRVELSAEQSSARIVNTLVLTRDTSKIWFREAGWEFNVHPGADPEAFFGISRSAPGAYRKFPATHAESYLFQKSYFQFGEGEKRFILASNGSEVLKGEEMGDWFMLQGTQGGLMLSCRESARQHPKEFNISGNRMNLLLFSNRAGEEMDFRTETLVKRWHLRNWLAGYGVPAWFIKDAKTPEERVERALATNRKIHSDALGWSKTHEILLSPAPAVRTVKEVAGISHWHSEPVFTLADPWWIYRSKAMGALYPKDPKRFPQAERLIDEALDFFASQIDAFGYRGYIDYNAGPTMTHSPGDKYPMPRRWNYLYTIRPDSWGIFARSGSRKAYEFATGVCRAWADNYFASWSGPRTVKGLPFSHGGPDKFTGTFALPFYWGEGTNQVHSNHMTNTDQFAYDYYLLGWRRAADHLQDYAYGLKQRWTPEYKVWGQKTILPSFRLLTQSYEFTWNPEFKELAYDAFDLIENPESEIGLHEVWKGHASSYKIHVHFRDVLDAWQIFGDPRFYRTLMKVGPYLWERDFLKNPVMYVSHAGILGDFLYQETGSPAIPQALLLSLRRVAASHDTDAEYPVAPTAPYATFYFEGIPAILGVIDRSNVDHDSVASWVGAKDMGNPVEFYLKRAENEAVHLATSGPGGAVVGGQKLELLNPPIGWDMMKASCLRAGGYGMWELAPDVPGGIFRFTTVPGGDHLAMAWGTRPHPCLVIYAPAFWVPLPGQLPPVAWYFQISEKNQQPALFFEKRAQVYAPDGTLWKETQAPGWVELDPDKPGLWSFVPLEEQLVKARNFQPVFAAENPESWFDPGLGVPENTKTPEAMPKEAGFVNGISSGRGFYLPLQAQLILSGGAERGEEGDREFLPFAEGTVEFWYKPTDWDSFSMHEDVSKKGVLKPLANMGTWALTYSMNGANPLPIYQYALNSTMAVQNVKGHRESMTRYRHNTLFEKDEWVHVAIVWGPRTRNVYGRVQTGLEFVTYFNGRRGTASETLEFRWAEGYHPSTVPKRLILYGGGVVDNLRISNEIRYTGDFEPSRKAPDVDAHTKGLFLFDDNLTGVSYGGQTFEAKIKR